MSTPAEAWSVQTVLELSCSLLGRPWSQLLLLGLLTWMLWRKGMPRVMSCLRTVYMRSVLLKGSFQSCLGGEAGVWGDQLHPVEAMLALNVSTILAVVQPAREESPAVSPEYVEPLTIE